jgi:hypothetical protein
MAVQSEEFLAMLGLGVLHDSPVDALQPPLVKAIHLRWSFGTTRSFPWYGYYLFRRPSKHRKVEPLCISRFLRGLPIQPINYLFYNMSMGIFSSDRDIVLTDDFPDPNIAEMDLRARRFLRFTCAEPAFQMNYKVGLRASKGRDELTCLHFTERDTRSTANPRSKNKVRFIVFDHDGRQAGKSRVRKLTRSQAALDLNHRAEIDLPCASDRVSLTVLNSARPGKVVALDKNGKHVDSASLPKTSSSTPVTVDLKGKGITHITIIAPQNEALLLQICYRCEKDSGDEKTGIRVRYLSGNTVLHEDVITGNAGDIKTGNFSADLITAVEFSGGEAAVIDICYSSVRRAIQGGWEPLEKCPQPIALPVRDKQYPASGSMATNLAASRNEALSRIRYGNPADWDGANFVPIHDALGKLVDLGPAGPEMRNIGADDIPATSSGVADGPPPTLARQRPMNYLLMGAISAPVAQMLGLYWADETAKPGETYDYLIIADHINAGQGKASTMLNWLYSPAANFNDIDAWVCFDKSLGSPAPLVTPGNLHSYALPGATSELPDGTLRDMTNNTGLLWDIPELPSGKRDPEAPVMYIIRRTKPEKNEPPTPVKVEEHEPLNKTPHVVTKPKVPPSGNLDKPSNWPNLSLCYIDAGLEEGWYSYRVNGIDLFGRYSAASDPAVWYQWTPEPEPEPWYYKHGMGDVAVHNFAISLLDKTPPPPPTAVEAFALDPKDPDIIRDDAYNTWFATLSPIENESVVGLRVRWLWTWSQMRQAPDASEFRVYWQSNQPNIFKGKTNTVNPSGANHSAVTTTITHSATANAFIGCYLRVNSRSFKITDSTAASPLQITVEKLMPDHSVAPDENEGCSISVPPDHPLYLDLKAAERWQERSWVVSVNDFTAQGVLPAPIAGTDGEQLLGEGATAAGNVVTLPVGVDISGIRPMAFHLYLAEDTARPSRTYRISDLNPATRQVTLDGNPILIGGISGWELGVLVRRYEVFLPVPGDADRDGVSLPTSITQPIAYGQVGVTAVDDKDHTGDHSEWNGTRWGSRPGNESTVGGPATVFRVHRLAPPAPQMPPDSEDVFASRADYHSKSYYTFRWIPQAGVDTHIYRALDLSIFFRDWLIRRMRSSLSASDTTYFPGGWNTARRGNAASELNAIDAQSDYAGLSADAQEVLGRLPGNEGYHSKGTLNQRDWLIRSTRSTLGSGDTDFFPADWGNALKRQQAADMLNAINSADDYNSLSNDALRVIAALPGNETAFQQITDRPLPNIGSKTANRRGPDNPASFPIDPALRAHVDAVDGRSTNKYFYRCAFIDAAQNIGELGLSSPPVRVPDVLPPRAPAFTRVLAGDPDPTQPGDKKITLRWTSNREADLVSYRVYRTDQERNARDTRLMDMIHEMPVPAGDPALRAKEITWLDNTVLGLVTYYYRLVAVDSANNLSNASVVIAARAYDTALPEPPVLTIAWVEQAGVTRSQLSWDSTHEVMIQRKEGGSNWIDLAQWRAPGAVTIRDPFSEPTNTYQYRALARKYTGALKRGEPVQLEAEE